MEPADRRHNGRWRVDMDWHHAVDAMFSDQLIARATRSIISERWNVGPGALAHLPGTLLLHQHHGYGTDEWLIDFPPSGFAFIGQDDETIRVRVAADSDAEARRILALLRAAVPESAPCARSVRVTFWRSQHGSGQPTTKDLEAPTWADMAGNYPAATEHVLAPLLAENWRPHAGRLLLWHGEPGTGKSYAVRALMQAWKAWCTFHVILDPERFFGSSPEYMMTVLLGQGDDDDSASNGNAHAAPWRLLILEDTGELLSFDAKDREGQGLSRLLNLSDGLLGQSLNVLVLITTNEDLGRLHPAATRPGRCLANVEFQRFDIVAAQRWSAQHGVGNMAAATSAPTLADLYSLLDGRLVAEHPSAAGFLAG